MKKTWKVLLCMALIMTMLLGSVAMAAAVPSAADQAAAKNHHAIAGLEGLNNGRDLGGYVTADGQYQIKSGLLLRTAKLADCTEGDVALLASMGVKKVIDLRMLTERLSKPDKKIPGAENIVISTQTIPNIFVITGEDWLMMLSAIKSGVMDTYMTGMYRQLISDPMAIRGTKQFFKEVLSAEGAVLWHCTSGKDRTGIEAYLLMCALGVSEEVARAEYLNTNVFMAEKAQANYDKAYKYTHSKWIATEFYKYEGVSEMWLDVALKVVARYGGVDAYLRDVIKLTDEDFAALREIYLQPVITAALAPAA
jgi:protein-tyrosine phosphatase